MAQKFQVNMNPKCTILSNRLHETRTDSQMIYATSREETGMVKFKIIPNCVFYLPSPRRVEKVRKVCWVVLGKGGWLEGGKVCEHDPVPARHHDVLHLDVAVTHSVLVGLMTVVKEETLKR